MPYNMWFLTPAIGCSPAAEWIDFVAEIGEDQRAELIDGTPEDWRQINVEYTNGGWSFTFERRGVADGNEEWTDDLSFFRGWLEVVEPVVNARWALQYLDRVKTVYLFRCSVNAPDTNLALVHEIVESLGSDDPSGILYAELEGWSNEDGQQITWEYSDRVTGNYWMALRRADGWTWFQMDRANPEHRRAFKAGDVPEGVETHTSVD